MRRLYHFTALHHLEGILADGELHGGVIPVPEPDGKHLRGTAPGWQWLTSDGAWRQSWTTRVKSRCDRTEVRLTVEVPLLEMTRLHRWERVADVFGFGPDLARQFAEIGGGSVEAASHWFVFRGSIPAEWIADVERRPRELGLILGKRCLAARRLASRPAARLAGSRRAT